MGFGDSNTTPRASSVVFATGLGMLGCNAVTGLDALVFDQDPSHATTNGTQASSGGGGGGVGVGGDSTSTNSPASTSVGGAGGQPAVSSTGSLSGGANQVACIDGTLCNVGEVCCFDTTPAAADHCGSDGTCDTGELQFACDGAEDCAPMGVCCATVDGQGVVMFTECGPCGGVLQFEVCNNQGDCGEDVCGVFPLVSYPGYGKCLP